MDFVRRAAFGDAAEFGNALHSQGASPTPFIKAFLERVDHPLATALMSRLDTAQKSNVDHVFLTSFGRFWADQKKKPQTLVEPDSWTVPLATAQSPLLQTPVRSLLVSGDQLVGKTSFLQLLAKRLAGSGWSVFEASGADLMAGQIWFGQLEGRVRQVVGEITVQKKLIWYVPDLTQLARSGTHQGQSASILDQIRGGNERHRPHRHAQGRIERPRPADRGHSRLVRTAARDVSRLVRQPPYANLRAAGRPVRRAAGAADRRFRRPSGARTRVQAARSRARGRPQWPPAGRPRRVRLAVTPLGDVPAAKLPGALVKAFAAAPQSSAVVRRYRGEPAPLVRSGDGSWRSGRLDAVLRGDFDLLGADEPPS